MDQEPVRQAESKVIPPRDPSIVFPEVAAIPPGQKSVVVLPKPATVEIPKPDEFPTQENDQIQETPQPK